MVDVIAQGVDGQVVLQDNTAQMIEPHQATLNITWRNQNGSLPDPVPYNSSDGDIKQWATEAVRNGDIPGINADATADFNDFIVDRFDSVADRPWNALILRPKTAFGGEAPVQIKLSHNMLDQLKWMLERPGAEARDHCGSADLNGDIWTTAIKNGQMVLTRSGLVRGKRGDPGAWNGTIEYWNQSADSDAPLGADGKPIS